METKELCNKIKYLVKKKKSFIIYSLDVLIMELLILYANLKVSIIYNLQWLSVVFI